MPRYVVATTDEIAPGDRKAFTVEGREIVVFNVGGDYVGLLNRCPHQGGKLCDGVLTGVVTSEEPGTFEYARPGEMIRCPWHGWFFDIRTGQSWGEPERVRTKAYDVAVSTGGELVEGPYQAETIEVMTDRDYVVVQT